MGTLGVQEMIAIFLVALVLFGPKKLPELGRTIGKAITEFRRASSDLKATFEREMQSLERGKRIDKGRYASDCVRYPKSHEFRLSVLRFGLLWHGFVRFHRNQSFHGKRS